MGAGGWIREGGGLSIEAEGASVNGGRDAFAAVGPLRRWAKAPLARTAVGGMDG